MNFLLYQEHSLVGYKFQQWIIIKGIIHKRVQTQWSTFGVINEPCKVRQPEILASVLQEKKLDAQFGELVTVNFLSYCLH